MRITLKHVLLTTVVMAGYAMAAEAAEHSKLIGEWKADDTGNDDAGTWILESKGDALKITHSMGNRKVMEFECGTTGRECAAKDSGKSAKVSMWFNGPKLVEVETRGDEVVKRRFGVGEKEDNLELEVIPVAPAGKSETLHLARVRK